jgi:ribitol 2-dehydrogenase
MEQAMQDLTGKVAIVTGASSGIGTATARALHKQGCRIALVARPSERLQAVSDELRPDAFAVPADMSSASEVAAMVAKTIEHFGQIDILFANAAVFFPGEFTEADPKEWSAMLDVNVRGVMSCAQEVLPHMIARRSGDILVTGSIAGHSELRDQPVYGATKYAIKVFVRALRRQVCADGIRVGSISPGTVATPIWGYTENDPKIAKDVAEHSVLMPEDIANIAVQILSQPSHVTIRDLVVLPQNQDI